MFIFFFISSNKIYLLDRLSRPSCLDCVCALTKATLSLVNVLCFSLLFLLLFFSFVVALAAVLVIVIVKILFVLALAILLSMI